MAIFPTGCGKSVCYILPPLILKNIQGKKYYSIVVSPLSPLMADQVRHLFAMGISSMIAGPDTGVYILDLEKIFSMKCLHRSFSPRIK